MLTEIANVLLHLFGTSGAVQPEHINREGLENGHHSGNIRPNQHRAGGFHGHADHQRPALAGFAEGGFDPLQGGLDLEDVLAGFNNEQIDIAGNQTFGLFGEGRLHPVEIDVAQGGELGGWPDGASHKAGFLNRAELRCHLPRQFRCPLVDCEGLALQVVFGQHDGGRPKGVGLDDIAASLKELTVNRLHRIWAGKDQVFIATLQGRSAEIFSTEVHLLERCSRRSVKDQDWPFRAMEPLEKADARRHLWACQPGVRHQS